uniref:Uncharacterized protein n=1 Tax=Arundo donax TaxID=35708 RepID=A0A0A9GXX8_ARUDO
MLLEITEPSCVITEIHQCFWTLTLEMLLAVVVLCDY